MKSILFILTFFLLFPLNTLSQTDIDGKWDGAIEIMGTELIIIVYFTSDDDRLAATIDIPQQGAANLSLSNVRHENNSVYFELPAGPGLAVFDGTLEDEQIKGKFTQAGIIGSFYLHRSPVGEVIQEMEPLPYNEENVYVYNDDIKLGCTLTLPFENGPHPSVILITGSGAQDRDETIFGFKPFRILADHLTPKGFAVLRCDDRGVGESTGNLSTSTSKDLAGDVLSMFAYLKGRDDIDAKRIGAMGHSEGGIIAAMVAVREPRISFIVSLAGSAVPGRDILVEQSRLIFREEGIDESVLDQQIEIINLAYTAAKTGEGWGEVEALIREVVPRQITEEQRASIADIDQYVEQYVFGSMAAVRSKWYRFFIQHNPADDWERVTQPVLGLFGELDLQVPPGLNKRAMKEALDKAGNTDYTLHIIPGANHLFQKAHTGSPTEYAQLEMEFIDGFLDIIIKWLDNTMKN